LVTLTAGPFIAIFPCMLSLLCLVSAKSSPVLR
jgi:hypothetical protein